MKYIIRSICLVFLFLTSGVKGQSTDQKIDIALILTDSYRFLGEDTAKDAQKALAAYGVEARINSYYHSDLDLLTYEELSSNQLLFIDIINAAKVGHVLPLLNDMAKSGRKVFAVGSNETTGLGAYTAIQMDAKTIEFYEQSGRDNLVGMVLDQCQRAFRFDIPQQRPIPMPEFALCNIQNKKIHEDFESYQQDYAAYMKGNPWIAINMWRSDFLSEQLTHFKEYASQFEENGFNVLFYYGYPGKKEAEKLFYDRNKRLVPEVILAQAAWLGANPRTNRELFEMLGIPVINMIQVNQTADEWMQSTKGIAIYKRTSSLNIPEQMGMVQPIVTSSKEEVNPSTQWTEKRSILFQVQRLLKRVQKMHVLQNKPNDEKQIALIYYSHPPGKELLGASYLNVVPNSLYSILSRLKKEGYGVGSEVLTEDDVFEKVSNYGLNIGQWAPKEIDKLVEKGKATLVPMELYLKWYAKLSSPLKKEIEQEWGKPEESSIMIWKDKNGKKYFVIPSIRYGNVLLTPQPVRGWSQDSNIMHHDISVPPHHQYVAFYLYLQFGYDADAVVHLGTHSTLEWLPGKETGLNHHDASEALIGDMVNVYPYIVDDVGEGLQAKRRSGAIIIDHMTPPFDKIAINPVLAKLEQLISEHRIAKSKSTALAKAKFNEIGKYAKQSGIIADLAFGAIAQEAQLHYVEHYIEEIQEQHSPLGLHTFGKLPKPDYIEKNVEAIVSQKSGLSEEERKVYADDIRQRIMASAEAELSALVDGLSGKYIPASTGNDPLRNPNSLPTGKNFYAFDADYIPSEEVYKTGEILAEDLIQTYQKEHNGAFPDKVTFNLWSTECIRNEGIMESKILSLLGVRPVYDGYGKVVDLKVVPHRILKRPRVDVILIPSGLYRDIFPQLVLLLDKAVKLASKQDEVDNYVRQNMARHYDMLLEQGVKKNLAKTLSEVRIFSTPDGVYGTGTNTVIDASGSWEEDTEVADVFINRMHFPYSDHFWGDQPANDSLLIALFKENLSGTKAVLHSRTSHLYASLDNDDFFQYLGGTALAIRAIDGESPEVIVSNLTNQGQMKNEKLSYFLSKELQARYFNPVWINSMLDEGYSGGRFVRQVAANLWGWQVTVPEAVTESKWDNFFNVYVEDSYELDIAERFEASKNLYAYQVMISRMYEAIRKSYWTPDEDVRRKLLSGFLETVEKVGLSCNLNVCNNPKLANFLDSEFEEVQGIPLESVENYRKQLQEIRERLAADGLPSSDQLASDAENSSAYLPKKNVKGYAVEELNAKKAAQSIIDSSIWKWMVLVLVAVYSVFYFARKRKKKD
ncbi:cobaltochelatase subunit CobN [Ulvibacterium sp.]|uniref:cobaltochelatase subunit CobN n=1 Tax=Ulvibacterium sp. TaxID=2665914 RepID=UPI002621C6E4|nr:cobaltochelatase subunit CobN [Ulvibacterium sp.]